MTKDNRNHNIFAGAFVDRHGHRREDPEWLQTAMQSNDSRFVPVWGDKCLASGEPLRAVLLSRDQVETLPHQDETIFLGMYREKPAFALRLAADAAEPFSDLGEYHDLRYLGSMLSPDDANLVAHARALVLWHAVQKFCGHCGALSRAESGGNSRVCVDES